MTPERPRPSVLIVTDDVDAREVLARAAERAGGAPWLAATARRARELFGGRELPLAVVDESLADEPGLELGWAVRSKHPRAQLLVLLESVERAGEALRLGATDWLERPLEPLVAEHRLRLALERRRLSDENVRMRARVIRAEGAAAAGGMVAALSKLLDEPLAALSNTLQRLAAGLPAVTERLRSWQRHLESRDQQAALSALIRALVELEEEVPEGTRHILTLARLSLDLRLFTFREGAALRPVDVEELLDRAAAVAQPDLANRAQLVKRYCGAPRVLSEPERLAQVMVNLLAESARTIPEGSVATHELRVTTSLEASGRAVVVELADTGAGPPPEAISQVLDPFSAAREAAATGSLGLSACSALLRVLGGGLEVQPRPEGGTLFRVLLPVAEG